MLGRRRSRNLRFVLCALAVLFLSGRALYGQGQQTVTATLSGSVVDPSDLAVSGATVTLTSLERGFSEAHTTGVSGLYTFTFVPEGIYTLEVEARGFRHYEQNGITLVAGQAAQQNVKLVVGSVSERIEVTSQAPLLNAENANISSDVSAREVEDLPLNFRSVISLSELNSSVSNTAEYQQVGGSGLSGTADQDISFLNFGGTFFDTAEYLLDGTWDTRDDWGGVIFVPSVDAVEEFKIQTNAFTAQYGWSSGNVINIVTKSGSNEFHGDAYYFYRNSALDAANFFVPAGQKPQFNRNQYGATFGGPLRKNKTFFFVSYEGLRQSLPAVQVFTVPTTAMRGGDFSALLGAPTGKTDALGRPILNGQLYNPFSTRPITAGMVDPSTGLTATQTGYIRDPFNGNILPPGLLDAIAKSIAAGNYWPAPATSALTNNFTGTGTAPENSDEYSIRVDHNFSDRDRVYARWSQKYQTKTNTPTLYGPSDTGGPGLVNPNNRYSVDVSYSHIFNPTFAASVNLGVNRHVEGGLTQSFGFKSSALGLPTFIDSIAPAFPQITESGYANLGASGGNNNYTTPQTLWTESVDFTKEKGKHELAFGFMSVWLRHDGGHYGTTNLSFSNGSTGGPDPQNETKGTGDGFASFLIGVGSGTDQTSVAAFPAAGKHFLGWYLQDSWKVTRKLTINPGLRYEIQTAPTERHNAQEYFDYAAANPISYQVGFLVPGEVVFNSPTNKGLYPTGYRNFAPRIGLAYQALNKMVFRAGYGVFYVPDFYGPGPNTGYSQTTPWVTSLNNGLNPSSTLSGNASLGLPSAFPTGELLPTGNSLGPLTNVGFGIGGVNPIRPTPYVQQWMAGIQFAFTTNSLLDISYVGNHGIHQLYQSLNWDTLQPSVLALGNALNNMVPNPFFGHIAASSCGLNNSMIVQSQLLRPYPEFCGVSGTEPSSGTSSYNALEATYTHRWHSGLDVNVSYTYSKFLDNVSGQSGWAFPGSGTSIRNAYNLAAEKSVDVTDTPNSLVVFYDYELPFGRGKLLGSSWNRAVNAILGGWQWSGIVTAKSGLPLSINAATNNTGSQGGAQRPNLVPGVSPIPQNQSITNWINPLAFSQPAQFTFGNAPRFFSYLRGAQYFDWDTGIQKSWSFSEFKRLQFRFEMFNALNHPDFFEPDTNLSDRTFGTINQAYPARSVQFAGKFYW